MPHRPNPRATLAGAVAVVIILVLGIWVFGRLDASQQAQTCMERRGGKCAAIDESTLPRR